MIFVTVGTHEQSFDRLLKWIDKLILEKIIKENVIVQKGYTEYELKTCESYKLIEYDLMKKYIEDARIVVTHGGPASFIAPLSIGKVPIVVPRKKEFREHVNNHQLEFARAVETRMKNIIVVEDYEELKNAILEYDSKVEKLSNTIINNNKEFNRKLQDEIKNIMEE